ncbi:hypothetical protein C8R44DRAFT_888460 [Mycena epipterygia]|nr:hypothetical protein C8R44DRAFT_888460 [Mycena epipterygia]
MHLGLEMIGYKETKHGWAVWKNPSELAMWTEAINAKFFGKGKLYERADWGRLLGRYMASLCTISASAITDMQHLLFAEELIAAYPNAKVVFTTRDPDSSWKSYEATVVEMSSVTLEIAKARFIAYDDEVRSLVPKERLLDYRVGEGWESLCKFLEKPVPAEAFPKVNDTQVFHERMDNDIYESV